METILSVALGVFFVFLFLRLFRLIDRLAFLVINTFILFFIGWLENAAEIDFISGYYLIVAFIFNMWLASQFWELLLLKLLFNMGVARMYTIIKVFIINLFIEKRLSIPQSGDLDRTFNYGQGWKYKFDLGRGASSVVSAIVKASEGKFFIGGHFKFYNGNRINLIAKINEDGSLDKSFKPKKLELGTIKSILIQQDKKVLISGHFNLLNDSLKYGIVRLNEDGSIDEAFQRNIIIEKGGVFSAALMENGKVVIGGDLSSNNLTNLICLNIDGSLDQEFCNNTSTFDGKVYSIFVQADSKVLVGGDFVFKGHENIIRLNSDGTIDNTFCCEISKSLLIQAIACQRDEKILIGGSIKKNYVLDNPLQRLNFDGSIDESFSISTGIKGGYKAVYCIDIDYYFNVILIVGSFTLVNGVTKHLLAALRFDGSNSDRYIGNLSEMSGHVDALCLTGNNSVIIGGLLAHIDNGIMVDNIGAIKASGGICDNFNKRVGPNSTVEDILIFPDGNVFISGSFFNYNSLFASYLISLTNEGLVNSYFKTGLGFNGLRVKSMALTQKQELIVVGEFSTFNNQPFNNVAKLSHLGHYDRNFNIGSGANGFINSIVIDKNDKILMVGKFSVFNNEKSFSIVRVNSDGSIDNEFCSYFDEILDIRVISLQKDGKILLGGLFDFQGRKGLIRNIVRLNIDGSIDYSFLIGNGTDRAVNAIQIQEDNKILIGGEFTSLNEIPVNGLARLNTNGIMDMNFKFTTTGFNYVRINTICLYSAKKIFIGGSFTIIGERKSIYDDLNIICLNADGMIDTTFSPISLDGGFVRINVIKKTLFGTILIAGHFDGFNGYSTPNIISLVV